MKLTDQTFNRILLVLAFVYAVSFLERFSWNYSTHKQNEQHKQEKAEYERIIENLENKLYQHEINLIKRNAAVDTLTNDELDSVWTTIDWNR